MTNERQSRWLSIVSNGAVFAGLVLVAFEIHQAQAQMELAALADGADNFTQAMETLSQDEGLARFIYRAEHQYEELDAFERWRAFKYLDGFVTMSEQDYLVLTVMAGPVDGFEDDWRENLQLPLYRDYWSASEQRFGLEFRAFINTILSDLER